MTSVRTELMVMVDELGRMLVHSQGTALCLKGMTGNVNLILLDSLYLTRINSIVCPFKVDRVKFQLCALKTRVEVVYLCCITIQYHVAKVRAA